MTDSNRFAAATLDQALTVACTDLRARVGELRYEVLEEGGAEGVVISAEVDPVAAVGLFLSELFSAGGLELSVRLEDEGDALVGELEGGDLNLLINGDGSGLDALQYLSNRVLDHRARGHLPVHLDGREFKARRARQLRTRAEAAAQTVVRGGEAVTLPPMTPAARREVHLALAEHPQVETESNGSGFLKRVVVRPRRRR